VMNKEITRECGCYQKKLTPIGKVIQKLMSRERFGAVEIINKLYIVELIAFLFVE
jgi:hypothetical protein